MRFMNALHHLRERFPKMAPVGQEAASDLSVKNTGKKKESFREVLHNPGVRYASALLAAMCLVSTVHFVAPRGVAYAAEKIPSALSSGESTAVQAVRTSTELPKEQNFTPVFTSALSDQGSVSSVSSGSLLKNEQLGIAGSGLYVDGEFLGAVQDGAKLNEMLTAMLNAAKGSGKANTAEFLSDVQCVDGTYPISAVLTNEAMQALIGSNKVVSGSYTVSGGEDAGQIAAGSGLNLEQLSAMNPGKDLSNLQTGDALELKETKPLLSVLAVKTETASEEIPFAAEGKESQDLYVGESAVEREGVPGTKAVVYRVTSVNGREAARETLSSQVIKQPISQVVLVGAKERPVGVATGSFQWPTPTMHVITTNFEYRWGEFHPGIDISEGNAYGQTIVASDGGTVTKAADTGDGYGNNVIIDHGNGFTTLYGHASELLVSAGQKVEKGQPIALVGSTGFSTGPHCHFEIIQNGEKVNPFNYVSG